MQRVEESSWRDLKRADTQVKKSKVMRSRLTARSLAAAAGIFSGIASLFVGLVCVAVHLFIHNDHMFDQVGSILLICAIPLMLAGSIVLDEAKPGRDD